MLLYNAHQVPAYPDINTVRLTCMYELVSPGSNAPLHGLVVRYVYTHA